MHTCWKIKLIFLCFSIFFSIQVVAGTNRWTATGPFAGQPLMARDAKVYISPHNPDIMYCYCNSGGEGGFKLKLFKSSDGGKKWSILNAYSGDGNLQFDPVNVQILYSSDDQYHYR